MKLPKLIFSSPVEHEQAALRQFQTARSDLAAGTAADRAKLKDLKERGPDIEFAALVGEPEATSKAVQHRRDTADLESKISGRLSAKPRLLSEIRKAILALGAAKAEQVRKEKDVEGKRKEREDHIGEGDRLIAAAEKHWGFKLGPADQQPEAYRGRLAREPNFNPRPIPRHIELEREITAIEAEANGFIVRATQAQEGTTITGETLEEILAQTNNGEILAPFEFEIRAWFELMEIQALKDWELEAKLEYQPLVAQGHRMPDRGRTITLTWDANGEIVLLQSSVKSYAVRQATLYRETPGRKEVEEILEPGIRMLIG
jgi:hypothetical protein